MSNIITRQKFFNKGVIKFFILTPVTVFALFPIVWMILNSFKPKGEIFKVPPAWFPSRIVFDNYIKLYNNELFLKAFSNTVILTLATVVVVIVIAFLAAYGLSRFRIKRKRIFITAILFSQVLPSSVRLLPLFIVMITLGLINTFTSVWLAYIGGVVPFGVFMLFGYLKNIPVELEEAAIIDGANRFKTMIYIIIPLSAPGIAAVAIYCFLVAWNEFVFANIFLVSVSKQTLPVALVSMVGEESIDWGQMMAGSVVTIIPVVIVLIIFSKFLISGLTKGAINE